MFFSDFRCSVPDVCYFKYYSDNLVEQSMLRIFKIIQRLGLVSAGNFMV